MQNDFNKYKESKVMLDNKQHEIDNLKKENDKLTIELMLIKSNNSNYSDPDHNSSKNQVGNMKNADPILNNSNDVYLTKEKYDDLIKTMEDMA